MEQAGKKVRGVSLACLMVGLSFAWAGCAGYSAKPLDLASHHRMFLQRTPDAPEVAAFVESLERTQAGGDLTRSFDLSDGVSASEAEVVALVFNAELRAARLKAGVALASAQHAGAWQDPSLGVDVSRVIQSVAHPWKLAASVALTVPISGRLRIEKDKADRENMVELARIADMEWSTRVEIRGAWAEWAALCEHAAAIREYLGHLGQVLGIVDLMEQAGEIARTEARLIRIEYLSNNIELARIESRIEEHELRIRQIMGLAPGAHVRLEPSGIGARFLSHVGRSPNFQTSPRLAVAKAEYEVFEQSLRLEVRRQYPDLTIGPGYGREDGNDQWLLGVSLPLPILNANRRAIAEARAARDAAGARVESVLEELAAESARAELRLRAANDQRKAIETSVVPLVDAQYAEARELGRLGEINTLVLLESLKRQHEVKLRYIEAAKEESLAAIRVEELFGPAGLSTHPDDSEDTKP